MASPSPFPPAVAPPGVITPIVPLPGGPTTAQASNTSPTPTLRTTTIYTDPALDYNPTPTEDVRPASGVAGPTPSNALPTNPSWGENSDNLTASPVYLFIFAIALGALIILSLTIVIRSLVLRQRLIAIHGPDWRRQYGSTILEMLGLSSRRMWPDPSTQPGPQPGRRRRKDHGQKPVLVEVDIGEGQYEGYWKDVQPYSSSLRHPGTINPTVKTNTSSLLSLRAKEYQPPPPRSSPRTQPTNTRAARDQPPATPTRPQRSPLRRLPFSLPPTSSKPPVNEKYTAPSRHSRSSSSSSVRDLKEIEQPLPGLAVDVCLLVRLPNPDAPSYRPPLFASVSEERRTPARVHASSLEQTVGGGLMIACAQGVQLWGIPEGAPPASTEVPENVDSRRGNGQ